jgi:hypothetical protein
VNDNMDGVIASEQRERGNPELRFCWIASLCSQ